MNTSSKLTVISILALLGLPACATQSPVFYDFAPVLSAAPIYQTVQVPVDKQVCWEEQVWHQPAPSPGPAILGAVIGGVVGHQFGGGSGKAALTVAGAAVGGAVGHGIAVNNQRPGAYPVMETRCEVQRQWRDEQQLLGWDVTYRYRGTVYRTRTVENPGRRIRIQVDPPPGYQ